MKQNNDLLILFAKKPVKGKVKTRLAKDIGEYKALDLHIKMLSVITEQINSPRYDQWLFWDSFGEKETSKKTGNSQFLTFEQQGNDLGERLHQAFQKGFETYKRVVVIGSDCPFVRAEMVEYAFKKLDECETVIGPALDGGYYLLGSRTFYSDLFHDISWGTEQVYQQTYDKVNTLNLSCHVLATLVDIDTKDDLRYLGDHFYT